MDTSDTISTLTSHVLFFKLDTSLDASEQHCTNWNHKLKHVLLLFWALLPTIADFVMEFLHVYSRPTRILWSNRKVSKRCDKGVLKAWHFPNVTYTSTWRVWGRLRLFTYRGKRNLLIWKPIDDSLLNTCVVTVNCSLKTSAVIDLALFLDLNHFAIPVSCFAKQWEQKIERVNPWARGVARIYLWSLKRT